MTQQQQQSLAIDGILGSSTFLGEPFFQINLPDYSTEYMKLYLLLGTCFVSVLFACYLPRLTSTIEVYEVLKQTRRIRNIQQQQKEWEGDEPVVDVSYYSIRKNRKYIYRVSFLMIILSIVSAVHVLLMSPNNQFLARRVFQVPVLTEEECAKIVTMSENTALRNVEIAKEYMEEIEELEEEGDADEVDYEGKEYRKNSLLLKSPLGWQKIRHVAYVTTDLNVWEDPFTSEEQEWLNDILNRRVAMTVSRIFGIPPHSLRADDCFVVRYSGDSRKALSRHEDGASITVNILLNHDFEGGGTKFWNRKTNTTFDHVKPSRAGTLLTHSSSVNHEGVAIDSGVRYILVALLEVDRFMKVGSDGDLEHSGVSLFATYFNLNWLHRRLIDLFQDHEKWITQTFSPKVKKLLVALIKSTEQYTDRNTEHTVEQLVKDDDAIEYIQALDSSYISHPLYTPQWGKPSPREDDDEEE